MRPAYGSPDGHGRYGILDRDDRRPICHERGRAFEYLATHVRVHGISAAEHRERHGLSPGLALVGDATRVRMSAAWERHRSTRLTTLEVYRDPNAAREASRESRWSPQQVAGAQARGVDRRGRALTDAEIASLGDPTDIPAWAERARALLEIEGVTLSSLARSIDMPTPTVAQRLRRYPRVSG